MSGAVTGACPATLTQEDPMLVYLSGPMTGLPGYNTPEFHRCTARLRELGFDVLNPAETAGGATHLPRATYMYIDVAYVQAADAVVVMDGWRSSKGAKLEMIVAAAHGKRVWTYDDEVGLGYELEVDGWDVHVIPGRRSFLSLPAQEVHS